MIEFVFVYCLCNCLFIIWLCLLSQDELVTYWVESLGLWLCICLNLCICLCICLFIWLCLWSQDGVVTYWVDAWGRLKVGLTPREKFGCYAHHCFTCQSNFRPKNCPDQIDSSLAKARCKPLAKAISKKHHPLEEKNKKATKQRNWNSGG